MKAKHLLNLKAELMIPHVTAFCRELGISKSTYHRWIQDPEAELPREIALAAAALVARLEPYEPGEIDMRLLKAFNDKELVKRVYPS